jgi:hypothetical protein
VPSAIFAFVLSLAQLRRNILRRNMRRPATITAPFGTPEESARSYGISPRRAKQLIEMVRISLEKKNHRSTNGDEASSSKNGSGSKVSVSDLLKTKARSKGKANFKSRKSSPKKITRAQAKRSH